MKKILVVDDSKVITATLQSLIEKNLHYHCTVAKNMALTQQKLEEHQGKFDVALLDIGLPDAPNGEVIMLVEKYNIPIIVLTGKHEYHDFFRDKKIVDYVIKDGSYSIFYAMNIVQQVIKNRDIKALVVDDSRVFLAQVSDLLKRYNLQVFQAKDGKEALDVFAKHSDIKVLFTDYDMPNMDGLELTKELRKKYKKSELSIIVTSGTAKSSYIPSKFLKYGANDFIYKGFSHEEFYTRLNSNLEILALFEDQKKAQEEKRKQDRVLFDQSKMATIGEVLHNISHHWRQPLNLISTIIGTLQAQKEFGEQIEIEKELDSYNKVLHITKDLSNTIDDFRDYFSQSKDAGNFDVVKNIEKFLELTQPTYKEKGILIEFKPSSTEIPLFGVEDDFRQIINSIFNNSKEAIMKHCKEDGLIRLQVFEEKNFVTFDFEDNGGGIDDEILTKIFEPYFTTKHQEYGVGLGLYVVREIIMNHFNGSIEVENQQLQYNNKTYKGVHIVISLAKT